MAFASTRVVVTRLSRSSRAHLAEWGLPSVGEPARLTTTSAASTRPRSRAPAYGSHVDWSGPRADPRTSEVTVWPWEVRASRRCVPRKPDAPARRTFTWEQVPLSDLEGAGLEPLADLLEEAAG